MPKFIVIVQVEADDEDSAIAMANQKILPDNTELVDVYPAPEELWADIPGYPMSDWNHEAGDGDTILGYHQWAAHKKEVDDDDRDRNPDVQSPG